MNEARPVHRQFALGFAPDHRSGCHSHGLGLDMRDVVQMATGSFLIAGIKVSMGSKDSPLLAEVDSIGRVMWAKSYSNGAESAQLAMHYTDDDRGVLLGAATSGFFDYPGTWEELPTKLLPLDLDQREAPVNALHLAP